MLDPGKVYLVGAGPGDPELITVRGWRCLQAADAVVYDRLVHPALLDLCSPHAQRHFVGKAPGQHSSTQEQISRLLVRLANTGLSLVRLKGGDPFVFGRGGEEAQTLTAAGIPWEVVPAVSSAVGVPAMAGIPVTHRGVAASFTVVTAHRGDMEQGASTLDWNALARMQTLVVLMGTASLPVVSRRLMDEGRDPQTPVAVIERGTMPDERVLHGTLATIASLAAAAQVRSPATIVVGEVVALGEQLGGQQVLSDHLAGLHPVVDRLDRPEPVAAAALSTVPSASLPAWQRGPGVSEAVLAAVSGGRK